MAKDLKVATLEAVNVELAERGLRPLHGLGDNSQGQIQFVRIKEFLDHNERFYTDVVFTARLTNGAEFPFPVRFNAGGIVSDGAVIVPVVNGLVGVVRQFRNTMGLQTWEFVRGFGDKADGDVDVSSFGEDLKPLKTLGTALRELAEEFSSDTKPEKVSHAGSFWENSGTSNVRPSVFIAHFTLPEKAVAKLAGSEAGVDSALWTPNKVHTEIGQLINDAHSLAAWALVHRHLN
jgi:8-oxo-dGTP pyrophosphatase MutT (NUDIX family)